MKRVVVLGRGTARIEARALSPQLQAAVLAEMLTVHGVVPRIGLLAARSVDTLTSLGDTLVLVAAALSTRGDTIRGAPITWSTLSGGANAALLDPGVGRIRATANGTALFRASVDSVTADRPVVVKQRPVTFLPAADTVILRAVGEARQLAAVARDARLNPIGGAAIVWTSAGAAVATVSAGGTVTAQGDGVTQVRARTPLNATDSLTATTTVIVARARLALASGDAQSGTAGTTLASPLTAQLVDSLGAVVRDAGIPVVFTAATTGTKVGGADSLVVMTDTLGQVHASLTLSHTAGANRVSVRGPGLSGTTITFGATGTAGALSSMAAASGSGQSGTVGADLAAPFVVTLVDAFGNGVAGQRVVFWVTLGGGKLAGGDSLVATTDSLGRADATLTLGRTAGADAVGAASASPSGSPVAFTATANPGAPISLAVTASPASGTAGAALTPAPQVVVRDTFGNTVTVAAGSITLTIVPGTGASGATLAGTPTVAAQGGIAIFANVAIGQAGAGYRLLATAAGLAADTSAAFDVTASAPDRVAFTVQPSRVAAGVAFAPSVEVTVQDAFGNRVAGATNLVAIDLGTTPFGGGGLFGTLQVPATNGVAVFSDARIGKVGAGYRLVTHSGTLVAATSTLFDVAAGTPASIAKVSGDNQNQVPDAPLDQPFVAQMRDAFLNVVPGDTVVFRVIAGGGHFGASDSAVVATDGSGNASAQYTLGAAPGTNQVQARSRRLPDSVATFAASATQAGLFLAFTVQPSSSTGGTAIAPSVKVAVQDGGGVTQTSATTIITLGLFGGTAGASLSGTVSVAAVSGVATFSNISVDKVGTGYQLLATASGVNLAASTAFDVATGPASRLRFATSPSAAMAGADLGVVQARIEDAGGNLVSSASDVVTVAIAGGTGTAGAHLRGGASVAASGGIAQFSALSIDSAGTGYALSATDGGVQSAMSATFAVAPAPASRLAFTVQPSAATAGAAIAPAIRVAVQDSLGNAVPSASPTLTLAITSGTGAAGAVLTGGSAAAQGGVASFASVSVNRSGAAYTLTASGPGLAPATSAAFDIASGAAARLGFVTEPVTTTAGQAIAPAVRVAVEDGFGNTVTGSSASVTLDIVSGTGNPGATLSGTRTVSTVNGVATFSTLSVDKVGAGYNLQADAAALTVATSAAFAITPASAESLIVVSGNNQNGLAGSALAAPFVVQVRDHFGNPIGGYAVVFSVTGGGGSFGGVGSVQVTTDGSGQAGETLTLGPGSGNNTAEARATGLLGSPAAFMAAVTTVGAKLGFVTQPGNATAGVSLAPQVRVAVQASDGTTVTSATSLVTLVLGGGTAGAHLRGVQSVNAVNGVATFSVSVDSAGTPYALTATSPGLTSATSATFAISPAPAARLGFVVQPSNTAFGGTITPAVQVAVQDSLGNTAVSAASIGIALTSGTGTAGATLGGTTTATAQGGLASFTNLSVDKNGSGYTLTATSSGLATGTSAPFGIFGGPVRLAFSAGPATATAGAALSPAPQVTVLDTNGNRVTNATTSITLALTGGTARAALSGTRTLSAVNGVATFSGLTVDSAGSTYRLAASGSGLVPDTAAAFDVIPGAPARVTFFVQPSSRTAGSVISPFVQVAVRDAVGNRATSATSVAVGIVSGTGAPGAVLSGTTPVTTSLGLATFSDLSVDRAATGYRLAASSSGLAPDTSVGFSITAGPLASVAVTPGTASIGALGATLPLAAEGRDALGNPLGGQSFTWSSGDTTIATVSATGLVTAVRNGSVVITATDNGISGTATLAVAQVVANVTVSPGTATLTSFGDTLGLTAVARDSLNSVIVGAVFTWSSNDSAVAGVSTSGLVTAAGNGTATITAGSGGKSNTATVTVQQIVTSVSVTPDPLIIPKQSSGVFTATALDANGFAVAGIGFTWSSNKPAVTVTANNPSTTATATRASSPASATITAASQGGGAGGSNVSGSATAN